MNKNRVLELKKKRECKKPKTNKKKKKIVFEKYKAHMHRSIRHPIDEVTKQSNTR